ncbi:MAG: hypothetical protein AB8C46_08225 [Burkholderiaceae bacterium]
MNSASQTEASPQVLYSDRVAVVTAKLQDSDRQELEYISATLGLDHLGKTDEELRHALINLMN